MVTPHIHDGDELMNRIQQPFCRCLLSQWPAAVTKILFFFRYRSCVIIIHEMIIPAIYNCEPFPSASHDSETNNTVQVIKAEN